MEVLAGLEVVLFFCGDVLGFVYCGGEGAEGGFCVYGRLWCGGLEVAEDGICGEFHYAVGV